MLINNGNIIGYEASENVEGLKKLLECDPGASRIGEFGIGLNPNIEQIIGNALFDEKVGGTIHLAIGQSCAVFPQRGGGLNESNVHQDMVCDLRQNKYASGGRIMVNNETVMRDGIWFSE